MQYSVLYKTLTLLALTLFLGGPAASSAQETDEGGIAGQEANAERPLRVGFVDMEIVLDNSRAIRSIVGEVDQELDQQSREIDAMRREVRRIQLSLEQQSAVLSDSERASRQRRAIELMDQIEESEYRLERKFRDQQRTVIGPLLEQIVMVVGDVSAREDFDLVVRGEMVLYGRSTADLTDKVIDELDEREEQLREALGQVPEDLPEEEESILPETLPLIP